MAASKSQSKLLDRSLLKHYWWSLRDSFQTLCRSRQPLWHMGQSGSAASTFDPPTTTPTGVGKKRDDFQTHPSDASPAPTSTTFLMPTEPASQSTNSLSSSASTEAQLPATSTATASLAIANRPHGTTTPSGKLPSCMRPGCRWPTSPTSSASTHRPSQTVSGAQVSPCDPDEAGHHVFAPNTCGAEHYRARETGRSRALHRLLTLGLPVASGRWTPQ